MSEFKRNPSKVWWGNDSMEYRDVTASPGSQDSGFSDTEQHSPPNTIQVQAKPKEDSPNVSAKSANESNQSIPKDIFKDLAAKQKPQNLNENFVEKCTPKKSISCQLNSVKFSKTDSKYATTPPGRCEVRANSEPHRRHRYTKNSPKVSRNLFSNARHKESSKDAIDGHQYSQNVAEDTTTISYELTSSDSHSWLSNGQRYNHTVPFVNNNNNSGDNHDSFVERSAPAILQNYNADSSFSAENSLSSDCESELECLFNNTPKHTSTPKAATSGSMRHRKKLPLELFLKYQQQRVTPILTEGDVNNDAVKKWLEEVKQLYEQECMTTLQSKSIMGELNQKISHLAYKVTLRLRDIISHSGCIEKEYQTLNSETKHIGPRAQSLAGNIMDYITNFTKEMDSRLSRQYDEIRKETDNSLVILNDLLTTWHSIHYETVYAETRALVERLEDPSSELDLRATVTGITSLALRNEELIEMFVKADIIPVLVILCEKCEAPSVRSLLLRALSTMCCNGLAIKQLEKFSGMQIIVDSLEDESRPEPERSEAIALLAQVTAPWIEDNQSIRGLQDHSKKLVKSLTKFISQTKCCQNLLLCAAALANLTTMDSKCIKYLLHQQTAKILLKTVKKRGPLASVYLLEQVATLVANMSGIEEARRQLVDIEAPSALLCFMQRSFCGEDVEKRLQQKAIIALSRLSGVKEAARQIVDLGGVEKLVKLCKEKEERYDSDAVLVASLATLRKIVDACGNNVVNAQDAQELVEPKLLDSFLAYSSQNESYV